MRYVDCVIAGMVIAGVMLWGHLAAAIDPAVAQPTGEEVKAAGGSVASGGAMESVPALDFHGVKPGATSKDGLLKNPRWGKPLREVPQKDGALRLEFAVRGYKAVVVTVRGGLVQTVDVTLPEGASPEQVARAFKLGEPAPETQLPAAALIGQPIPPPVASAEVQCRPSDPVC